MYKIYSNIISLQNLILVQNISNNFFIILRET